MALSLLYSMASRAPGATPTVKALSVPDDGIQPQALVDTQGVLHLIYFRGEPGNGDLFYVRRGPQDTAFSSPLRVNSEAGSAIATGTVRGGQISLGRDGRVHVAWNGSRPLERNGTKQTPMWYARLAPGRRAFEPQRAIGTHLKNLDGGGSIAADAKGNVYVTWHAAGDTEGEPHRRLYVSASRDDGGRFEPEQAFANEGGACGCCGVRTLVDARGRLQVLYRSAGADIHRDAMWMIVEAGRTTAPLRLQEWQLPACPLTTFAMTQAREGVLAAWETEQQIYVAMLGADGRLVSAPLPMTGTGVRAHPSVAVNAAGERLITWTEGTAWARGGTFAWELQDRGGRRLASQANAGAVPIWSLVSAVAQPGGTFVIIH